MQEQETANGQSTPDPITETFTVRIGEVLSTEEPPQEDETPYPTMPLGKASKRYFRLNYWFLVTILLLLLFIGGLVLEITGVLLWAATHSSQTGLPLCVAGFLSVFTTMMVRRQQFKR